MRLSKNVIIKKCYDIETKDVIDLFKNKKYSESFEKYKTTSFYYYNSISFEKILNDNGLEKELKPFIDELKKYEGTYRYDSDSYNISPEYNVHVSTEEMTITLSDGRYTNETWSYNWQIGEFTYKSLDGNVEYKFDKNKEKITKHEVSGKYTDEVYSKE